MTPSPGLSPGELDDPWAEASSPSANAAPLSTSPEGEGWGPDSVAGPGPSTASALETSLRASPAVSSPLSPGGSGLRSREQGTRSPASQSILAPKPRARSGSLLNSLKYSRSTSQPVNLENLQDIDPDVSRPSLKRLTSETERQLWEDSTVSSRGGSFDRERDKEEEVEVIVHQVVPSDSLAGLALRYGIDVSAPPPSLLYVEQLNVVELSADQQISTLRKVNKLWPSDPVHVRTSLFVPLEACHPTSGTLVRKTGHVSLVPHRKQGPKSPKQRPTNGDAVSVLSDKTAREVSPEPPERQEVLLGEGEDPLTSASTPSLEEPGAIVLQVIKLPASKLHLHPSSRRRRAAASSSGAAPRASIDSDASALSVLSGLSGGLTTLSLNNAAAEGSPRPEPSREDSRLFGLFTTSRSDSGLVPPSRERQKDEGRFAPLMPRVDGFGPDDEPDMFGSKRGKRIVKLRPPVAAPHPGTGLVGRISDFFNPPPPPLNLSPHRPRQVARIVSEPVSRDSSRSASPAVTNQVNVDLDVELDAKPRCLRGSKSRPRTNKKTD